ncbi:hypothetical protein Ait01nite_095690 [Actinoplanes italicus]|uniref:HEAT repeat protein n=1 Tax=Actinoplanes italicus TaxID=113567 RepID=A0A2T0JNB5_9ACTN|nr:DUF6493 family protein [Actinoplanes italicus]PRX08897.1 hypothetical protein CLV67_13829 [Actinoplanes italicus]GIE36524.1 hypothetical protein Ait01nite_095690 [Actinoplanes italicus]
MNGSDLEKRLLAVIDEADDDAVVALLAPLSETERAALEPSVAARADELHRLEHELVYDFGPRREGLRHVRRQLRAAHVAWAGVGTPESWPPDVSIHDDNDGWYRRGNLTDAFLSDTGYRVITERRPPWLARLADGYLDYGPLWCQAWRLAVEGFIDRPADDRYLHGIAENAGQSVEQLAAMVDRDPALLDVDLPALLDQPGGLDVLVRRDERYTRTEDHALVRFRVWAPLLGRVLAEGHPLRERLLDGLLDAMGGDIGTDAPKYKQFLADLKPTVVEFAARRQRLLRLAGHQVPGLVSFGVQTLLKLDRTGRIDPADVVEHLGAATGAPAAGTARGAIKLIVSALRRRPDLLPQAVDALVPALTHTRPDVQQDAVEALLPHLADPLVRQALTGAVPDMAPAVAVLVPLEQETVPEPVADLAGLIAEAHGLGLGPFDATTEPPAVVPRPWLDARPGPEIPPVASFDELIDVLLRVVDGTYEWAHDLERALDGLAALHTSRPDDFGLRVGPLVDRVNRYFEAEQPEWGEQIRGDFCHVVAHWLDPGRELPGDVPLGTPRGWLAGRLREVLVMFADGATGRLLAYPQDRNGWVDPAVLTDRVIAAGDPAPDRPLDIAIAITRLAPQGRDAARERLAGVPGVLAAAVRAGCGSGEDLSGTPEPVRRAVGWLLGQPHDGAPYLFGEPADAPPAELEVLPLTAYQQGMDVPLPDGGIFLDMTHLPEYQAWQAWHEFAGDARYSTAWASTLWPGDTRWIWTVGLHARRALPWLLDAERPLPGEAFSRVLGELTGDRPERRALAADVLTQVVTDGRLTSAELGAALGAGRLWEGPSGYRIVEALTRVAAVSALHATVVRRSLALSLPTWRDLAPRALCALLTLLDQLCTTDGTDPAGEGARAALITLADGRGKAAGLARKVLAHPADGLDWPGPAAAAALTARLDRARGNVVPGI